MMQYPIGFSIHSNVYKCLCESIFGLMFSIQCSSHLLLKYPWAKQSTLFIDHTNLKPINHYFIGKMVTIANYKVVQIVMLS